MTYIIVFLLPIVIGLLLTRSDSSIGPIPIKMLGYILIAIFGLFLVLLIV